MKSFVTLVFLILITAATVAAETQTIHCPAEPPLVRRLQLQEQWRIDADDSDAPILGYFDQSQIMVHDDRVYLLDRQLSHVLVYSNDGEYLDTIMREGDGPGEIRNPGVMFLCSDGRIAVQHGYPSKIEFVGLDGTPQGRWRLQANAWINKIQESPLGWFGVYAENKQSDEPGVFNTIFHVAIHDDEGERTEEFFSEAKKNNYTNGGTTNEADDHNPWYTAVVAGGNQVVYAASRDEYKLEWINLSGETTRVVTRDFSAHRRTKTELDKIEYSSYSIVNGNFRFTERKLCDLDPMIRTLEPLPDGSLRVRTSLFDKDLPQGMVCRYEVHEPTGELRERVEIYDPSGDFDTDYDVIALLDDGRAMVLRNLRPAFRVATDGGLYPEQQEKLPPIPDDRDDVSFTPVMCDLVPYAGMDK